jgi:elongation factor Ts
MTMIKEKRIMAISMENIKELREKTGAGMMDCKKALEETGGDADKAFDFLRKKGLAKAAKKAGRIAAEGVIACAASGDGRTHAMVEVNCETDFVVKTDDFQKYAAAIAGLVLNKKPANLDDLLALDLGGKPVKDSQTDLIAKIGENIGVRRFVVVAANGAEKLVKYVHPGSKIVSLVLFDDPSSKLAGQLAREVAMHVAAMQPMYVRKEDVPEDYISKEKDIYREQLAAEKKPAEMIEKILLGKIGKHLSEICLEDQIFVTDPDGKLQVKSALKKADAGIRIKSFVRFQVGEGIEKKKSDLAAEVAAMVR